MPMPSGYCFEYQGRRCWRAASSERWDTVVHTPDGKEKRVGTRRIDDAKCVVYVCSDGKFRAVTAVAAGEGS